MKNALYFNPAWKMLIVKHRDDGDYEVHILQARRWRNGRSSSLDEAMRMVRDTPRHSPASRNGNERLEDIF